MAKVLFIEKRLRNEKMGLMALSAVLKAAGHAVGLVQTDLEDAADAVSAFAPDFVGYSIMTGDHGRALETNAALKSRFRFASVFGGPHCTFFPEIAQEEGIDYVIRGAADRAILDVVEGRLAPGIHRGDIPQDMDALPDPDREILYKYPTFRDNPIKNFMTVRDCPYNCAYCYNHLWKAFYADQKDRLFQRRSVDRVIREILAVKERYGLEKVNFLDDSFIQSRKWVEAFCEAYGREVGLPFLINVRVNRVEESMVEMLTKAGLRMVNFALESVSPDVQQRILNRGEMSNEKVAESIALFRRYGVRIRMQNMIGLPMEDPLGEALKTLAFNLEHRVEDSWVSIFQPYPRTKLAELCESGGFIEKGSCLNACAESFFDESRLNIPDRDRIARLQKWWYFIVRYNLPMELVRILLDIPLPEDPADAMLALRFEMSKAHFYGL